MKNLALICCFVLATVAAANGQYSYADEGYAEDAFSAEYEERLDSMYSEAEARDGAAMVETRWLGSLAKHLLPPLIKWTANRLINRRAGGQQQVVDQNQIQVVCPPDYPIVPPKYPGQVQIQKPSKGYYPVPEPVPGKWPEQVPGQVEIQVPGQVQIQKPSKGYYPVPEKVPGKWPEQVPGKWPEQVPGKYPEQVPPKGHYHNQGSAQGSQRYNEEFGEELGGDELLRRRRRDYEADEHTTQSTNADGETGTEETSTDNETDRLGGTQIRSCNVHSDCYSIGRVCCPSRRHPGRKVCRIPPLRTEAVGNGVLVSPAYFQDSE